MTVDTRNLGAALREHLAASGLPLDSGASQRRMLEHTVDAARRELGLDVEMGPAAAGDALAFLGWVLVVIGAYVVAPGLFLVWLLR